MTEKSSKQDLQKKAHLYLSGQLGEAEAAAFEAQIKSDPQSFAEVKHLLVLHAAMAEERREKLAETIDQVKGERKTRRRRIALAASVALVCFFGVFAITKGGSDKRKFRRIAEDHMAAHAELVLYGDSIGQMRLPLQDWEEKLSELQGIGKVKSMEIALEDTADMKFDSVVLNMRKSMSPILDSLAAHFTKGDFLGMSFDIHDMLKVDSSQSDAELFFWGIHCVYSDDYETATAFFKGIHETGEYSQRARWYLSLCYLHLNQPENAWEELAALSEQGGYKKEEVDELLREIESILGAEKLRRIHV